MNDRWCELAEEILSMGLDAHDKVGLEGRTNTNKEFDTIPHDSPPKDQKKEFDQVKCQPLKQPIVS